MHQNLPQRPRKIYPAIVGFVVLLIFAAFQIDTQTTSFQVSEVKSAEIISQNQNDFFQTTTQELTLENDKKVQYSVSGDTQSTEQQLIEDNQNIITFNDATTTQISVVDQYRLPGLVLLLISFLIITLFFTGKETLYSFLSLSMTIVILLTIIQAIFNGTSPLLATIAGCLAIGTVSIYIAHGFNTKTHLSTASIVTTLLFTLLVSLLFTQISNLTGVGSESSFYLANSNINIDLKSLLLAGILVGTLGVLDDITTSQIATIHEIHDANPKLSFHELYDRGLNVGKTHITSLINTLVLAYAGGSLPLLLLLYTDPSVPTWVTLNQEFFAEEIIRTLIGSMSLVIAVPISTLLAAKYYSKKHKN